MGTAEHRRTSSTCFRWCWHCLLISNNGHCLSRMSLLPLTKHRQRCMYTGNLVVRCQVVTSATRCTNFRFSLHLLLFSPNRRRGHSNKKDKRKTACGSLASGQLSLCFEPSRRRVSVLPMSKSNNPLNTTPLVLIDEKGEICRHASRWRFTSVGCYPAPWS